jgi:hypothetical protein
MPRSSAAVAAERGQGRSMPGEGSPMCFTSVGASQAVSDGSVGEGANSVASLLCSTGFPSTRQSDRAARRRSACAAATSARQTGRSTRVTPRVTRSLAATRTRGHQATSRQKPPALHGGQYTQRASEKGLCRSSFYASRHSSSGGSSAPASRTVTCHRSSVARCCAPSCGLEAGCEAEGGGVESTCSRAEGRGCPRSAVHSLRPDRAGW